MVNVMITDHRYYKKERAYKARVLVEELEWSGLCLSTEELTK
jgi:hypothetical protein